jgi:GNAT superfamily N-acetyltransferase
VSDLFSEIIVDMSQRLIFAQVVHDVERELLNEFRDAALEESSKYRGHMDFRPTPSSSDVVVVAGVAGSTTFGLLSMYDVGERGWFIDLLYVQPDARGVGIGSAMMEVALAEITQRGGLRINAAALPGDRSTKNLFERHGLVAQMITVGKTLN